LAYSGCLPALRKIGILLSWSRWSCEELSKEKVK